MLAGVNSRTNWFTIRWASSRFSTTGRAIAVMGEPQRGIQPVLQHSRGERLLRAVGINIQPIDQMRIAKQQQREAERKRNEPLYDDPATISGIVNRILRYFGW